MQTTIIEAKPSWKLVDLKECIEYKDLLYYMVLRDITVLYKQTILGVSWAIINPLFSMVVFTIIFGGFLKMPSDGTPYAVFSFVALLPWTYFAQSLTGATNSLVQGTNLFTKVYFPRIFMPLVPMASKLVDFGVASVVLAGLMIYYKVMPTINVLFLPMLLLQMIAASSGLGLLLAALAVQYRDVRHAMGFLIQALMYAAPVVWPASMIPDKYRLLYGLYPMVGVIEGFRSALLGGSRMPWDLIMMGSITSGVLLIAGMFYFKRMEMRFADLA
jgi:lipopolysaccharide transport system permease protein